MHAIEGQDRPRTVDLDQGVGTPVEEKLCLRRPKMQGYGYILTMITLALLMMPVDARAADDQTSPRDGAATRWRNEEFVMNAS